VNLAAAVVLNVAVIVVFEETVVVHVVDVPEHEPPVNPTNVDVALGVAVRVTDVPDVRAVEVQVVPQLIPPVLDVTVPEPVPAGVTDSVKVEGGGVVPP